MNKKADAAREAVREFVEVMFEEADECFEEARDREAQATRLETVIEVCTDEQAIDIAQQLAKIVLGEVDQQLLDELDGMLKGRISAKGGDV